MKLSVCKFNLNPEREVKISPYKFHLMQEQISEMQDIQTQLGESWEIDHREYVAIEHEFRTLRRMCFFTMFLVVCLVLDRLRIAFF
jgi:hypothetical protein